MFSDFQTFVDITLKANKFIFCRHISLLLKAKSVWCFAISLCSFLRYNVPVWVLRSQFPSFLSFPSYKLLCVMFYFLYSIFICSELLNWTAPTLKRVKACIEHENIVPILLFSPENKRTKMKIKFMLHHFHC